MERTLVSEFIIFVFLGAINSLMDLDQDQQQHPAHILLCILWELAVEGSMAGTVAVSDKGQVTPDTWHLTPEKKKKFLKKYIVVVLQSADTKRFSVSLTLNLYIPNCKF